jgi:hypothetical protein
VKEREVRRYLEYLGLEPPQPSKRTVVGPPSSEAKAVKKNKKQTKR